MVRVILRVLWTERIRRPISLAFAIYPFTRCIPWIPAFSVSARRFDGRLFGGFTFRGIYFDGLLWFF